MNLLRPIFGAMIVSMLVAPCRAAELKIIRGGNGGWTWTCAVGGHTGVRCGLQPVSGEAIAVTFNGLPRFSGPYISPLRPNPLRIKLTMHVDDLPAVPMNLYPPESVKVFFQMMKGHSLFVDLPTGNASGSPTAKLRLDGLRQAYCETVDVFNANIGHQLDGDEEKQIRPLASCD